MVYLMIWKLLFYFPGYFSRWWGLVSDLNTYLVLNINWLTAATLLLLLLSLLSLLLLLLYLLDRRNSDHFSCCLRSNDFMFKPLFAVWFVSNSALLEPKKSNYITWMPVLLASVFLMHYLYELVCFMAQLRTCTSTWTNVDKILHLANLTYYYLSIIETFLNVTALKLNMYCVCYHWVLFTLQLIAYL